MINSCDAFTTNIVYYGRGGKIENVVSSLINSTELGKELVSVDLSCVKSHFAPGVGLPSPAMGLTDTQICDIAHKAGQDQSTRIFSISEYNPAIEKYRTGALLQLIFSSFVFGVAKHSRN